MHWEHSGMTIRFDITGIVLDGEKDQVTKKLKGAFPGAVVDFSGVRAEKIDIMITSPPAGDFAELEVRVGNIMRDCNFPRHKIFPAVTKISGQAPVV